LEAFEVHNIKNRNKEILKCYNDYDFIICINICGKKYMIRK